MTISLAHLGPVGTYSESAALAYGNWLEETQQQSFILCPQPSIASVLNSLADRQVNYGIVPVENSIEGTVNITLDTLWQNKQLKILRGLTIPIVHSLLSYSDRLEKLQTVYSHPQALGQCQTWLSSNLPQVQLIPASSTTEALKLLAEDPTAAAISSARAAQIYQVPVLASTINDRPDNCTRFLVVGDASNDSGRYISLAFSLEKNISGALVKPLQIFAEKQINLSKIESRPTKRSLGEYIFFLELEGSLAEAKIQSALTELAQYTEELTIFGNYDLITSH